MSSKAATIKKPRLDRDLVVVPDSFDDFDDNIYMAIYADKVAYIDFTTKTTTIIRNPLIARFQEKLFKIAFQGIKGMNK